MKLSKTEILEKMKQELVFTILKYRESIARLPEGELEMDKKKRVFIWEYVEDDKVKKKELDAEKDWRIISELMFKRSLEEDEDMCMVNLCAIGEYLDGESDKLTLLVKKNNEPDVIDLTDSDLWDEFLPMFRTNGGDYVCTISEAIIAENLFRRQIEYKYKQPLELVSGREIVPTFTLYDRETGERKYIEHQEMLEDERKANKLCANLNAYLENDLIYGRDVVLSIETKECPLDVEYVMDDVDRIFYGNMSA